MNDKKLYSEYCGQQYEHGNVKVVTKNSIEWKVNVEIDLVLHQEEYTEFCSELEKVIKKFSI